MVYYHCQTAVGARYHLLFEITGYSPGYFRSPQARSVLAITLQNKLRCLEWPTPPFVSFMFSAIILQDFLSGKLSECQGLRLKSHWNFKEFLKFNFWFFFLKGEEGRECVQINLWNQPNFVTFGKKLLILVRFWTRVIHSALLWGDSGFVLTHSYHFFS